MPNLCVVKKSVLIVFMLFQVFVAQSQCSMCTKTASTLDDKSAKGLNTGIIYLALMPLAMIGFVGFTWWKKNKTV